MYFLKKYAVYLLLALAVFISTMVGVLYVHQEEENVAVLAPTAALEASYKGHFPNVILLSIGASPFHQSFEAHIDMDGVRSKVSAGQSLANGVQVLSIDAKTLSLALGPQVRSFSLAPTVQEIRAQESKQAVLELSERFSIVENGLLVTSETPLGLSSNLGLLNGDVVTHINGQVVRSVDDLKRILKNYDPGVDLVFKGMRKGEIITWQFQAEDNG
jgi:hypothetical protein